MIWVNFCKHLNNKEIFLLTCSFSDYLLSSSNRLASKQEPVFIIRLFLLQYRNWTSLSKGTYSTTLHDITNRMKSQTISQINTQFCSLIPNNYQIWGWSHSHSKEFKARVILESCLIRVILNMFYCAIRFYVPGNQACSWSPDIWNLIIRRLATMVFLGEILFWRVKNLKYDPYSATNVAEFW